MKLWGRTGPFWIAATLISAAAMLVGVASADPPPLQIAHGVSVSKGCLPITFVGQPDLCTYTFQNHTATGATSTPSLDTVDLTSVSDQVSNAGGPTTSPELLPLLPLIFG